MAEPRKTALGSGPARWFPIEACLRPKRLRLLDCMSGPWPLLSGQTFSDGVALVARLARAVKRWLGAGAVYRRINDSIGDMIPCPAHWMDRRSACRSHRQAGQADPECLLSMGTSHSLADAAAALAGLGAVPEFLGQQCSLRPCWQ